jgi:hypothetical protein
MYEERRGALALRLFFALPTTLRRPFASPPDDLVPPALLTLSARAPVPVPSPRPCSSPEAADGVEPARCIDTASTYLPNHTCTDVAIRECGTVSS